MLIRHMSESLTQNCYYVTTFLFYRKVNTVQAISKTTLKYIYLISYKI